MGIRLLHFALWLAFAALCFGMSVERNPIKKKGAGPLFRIAHGEKWGFMNRTGKVVIQPQFFDAGDFFEGVARVTVSVGKDDKSCFVDETGRTVIPCIFDDALDFSEGLAPVRVERRWGYINRRGKMVIQPQFQGAAEFRGGLGRFRVWDRIQCGSQAYTKDDAPPRVFVLREPPMSGCVAEHQRFGYVDRNGRVVIQPSFFVAEDFSEGLAAVRIEESATSKYAFIDKTGSVAIPAQFDQAYAFSEGLAAAEIGFRAEGGRKVAGKWGFIDKTGKFAITPRFELVRGFSQGLAAAEENLGSWGFIDRTGRFVIPQQYDEAQDFSEGLSFACPDSGGCAYIDRQGKAVLKVPLAGWPFSDGLTIVGEYGKRVYVDRKGKTVAPYEK